MKTYQTNSRGRSSGCVLLVELVARRDGTAQRSHVNGPGSRNQLNKKSIIKHIHPPHENMSLKELPKLTGNPKHEI